MFPANSAQGNSLHLESTFLTQGKTHTGGVFSLRFRPVAERFFDICNDCLTRMINEPVSTGLIAALKARLLLRTSAEVPERFAPGDPRRSGPEV